MAASQGAPGPGGDSNSFFKYPETPSQLAYAMQHHLNPNDPSMQQIDPTHLAFDGQGNPVQLYDQSGQPLAFDPSTRTFYDPQGRQVHIDPSQPLFDHLGQPLVSAGSPPSVSNNGSSQRTLGDPNGADLNDYYDPAKHQAELDARVKEAAAAKSAAEIEAQRNALKLEGMRVEMEQQKLRWERERLEAESTKQAMPPAQQMPPQQMQYPVYPIQAVPVPVAPIPVQQYKNTRTRNNIVRFVCSAIILIVIVSVVISVTGVFKSKGNTDNGGSSGGSGATGVSYQFRNSLGLCMAAKASGSVAIVTTACETAPVPGTSLQLWNQMSDSSTGNTVLIHATLNRYLCLDTTSNSALLATTQSFSSSSGGAVDCSQNSYRIIADTTASTLVYKQGFADVRTCLGVNLQLEDVSYAVCDTTQTWTPIQAGNVSSVAVPALPQSYQIKSNGGCVTVNSTILSVDSCESNPKADSGQIFHFTDAVTAKLIPGQYIFHTPTGKRFCYASGAAQFGSGSGLNDYCSGEGVFFVPAKTSTGTQQTSGTLRASSPTGYCLQADLVS
ncbi:hypothetical protein HK101_004701 [Irineochytrium annulatum]|nr:hypothetical protein HK101_004701 [Irineochytrium annulatum]